jgi:hypothetical protein
MPLLLDTNDRRAARFVREDWVSELDFSTLEKVPASLVGKKMRKTSRIWSRCRTWRQRFRLERSRGRKMSRGSWRPF